MKSGFEAYFDNPELQSKQKTQNLDHQQNATLNVEEESEIYSFRQFPNDGMKTRNHRPRKNIELKFHDPLERLQSKSDSMAQLPNTSNQDMTQFKSLATIENKFKIVGKNVPDQQLTIPSKQVKVQQKSQKPNELDKFSKSLQQYQSTLKKKNPMSSFQIIMVSCSITLSIGVGIPLSYGGVQKDQCELEIRQYVHAVYLILVGLHLVFADFNALLTYTKLKQKDKEKHEFNTTTLISRLRFYFITVLQIIGSASYIYEIYFDFLIFWIGIFHVNNILFGFCAIIFPLLNRILHIILCIKLLVLGIQTLKKSIKPVSIDETLISLNQFHLSKLLYTNLTKSESKSVLWAISVKELLIKILQITLKIVLISSAISQECLRNKKDIMVIGIIINLTAFAQLIQYFIYVKFSQNIAQQADDFFNNMPKVTGGDKQLELVINDQNCEIILKSLNSFFYKNQNKFRALQVSFQLTRSPQKYKEIFLKQLQLQQSRNQKFKELLILETHLTPLDFDLINSIIIEVPRIARLSLIKCNLEQKEEQCFNNLIPCIQRKKNFKALIIDIVKGDRRKILQSMEKLMHINFKLSVQVITLDEKEIYDQEDKEWFVRTKSQGLNPTLFTLKYCEMLVYDLANQQCEDFNLVDLDNYFIIGTYPFAAHNTKEEVSFKNMVVQSLKGNKFKNVQFRLRSQQSLSKNSMLSLNESQSNKIIDHLLVECLGVKNLQIQGDSVEVMNHQISSDFSMKISRILNVLINLQTINFTSIDLSAIKIFQLLSKLQYLSSLTLDNVGPLNLIEIEQLKPLEYLSLSSNNIVIHEQDTFLKILSRAKTIKLSNNPLFREELEFLDINETKFNLASLNVSETNIQSNFECLIIFLCSIPTIKELNLSNNSLTDEFIDILVSSLKSSNITQIDLSDNKFTSDISDILEYPQLQQLKLKNNMIDHQEFFAVYYQETEIKLQELDLTKQSFISNFSSVELTRSIIPKQFSSHIRELNLSFLKLPSVFVLNVINSLSIKHSQLQKLDLSGNDVTSKGCKHLNLLAQKIRTLKEIKVEYANISCSGLSYLWLAFNDEEDDLTLDSLSVRGNKIPLQWALRLNFKLTQPLKVKELNMSHNKLTDKGAKEIQIYFNKNNWIKSIDLSYNQVKREGLRRMRDLLEQNGNIEKIIVRGNTEIMKNAEMCERTIRVNERKQRFVYF